MTDDNSNLVDMEDLDSFEKDFYEAPKEIEVEVDDT